MLTCNDNDTPGDLAEIHEQHGPMLVALVAGLAKRGLNVDPAETFDLLHDFYIDALPLIVERYDPSQARFSTYLYGAFRRFVLKRTARSNRWKRVLVPLDEAIAQEAVAEEPPPEPSPADLRRLSEVLGRLPLKLRDMLVARLQGESDRLIGARLGLTRYAVGQTLAEALGRAAIAMDCADAIRDDLRPLALRLWRDEIPLTQVAKELGISRCQAGKRYRELLGALGAAVAALENVWSARRERSHV